MSARDAAERNQNGLHDLQRKNGEPEWRKVHEVPSRHALGEECVNSMDFSRLREVLSQARVFVTHSGLRRCAGSGGLFKSAERVLVYLENPPRWPSSFTLLRLARSCGRFMSIQVQLSQ